MQFKWSSPAVRNVLFCTAFRLSWDHFGIQQFSHEANQLKRSSFSVRLLVCLHVDILFCHFSKPPRTHKPNAQRKRFIWTLLMFSRPPTVAPLLSINSFKRRSELWHKHLHFTISTRKQTVAWHQISLSFSGFLSPLSLLLFLLNYFYNDKKHLGGWYQETKNRAYYSSVVTSQRFKPVF